MAGMKCHRRRPGRVDEVEVVSNLALAAIFHLNSPHESARAIKLT